MTVRLTEPGLYRDPHPVLRRLRASDPVHWSEELSGSVLLRYEDVAAALRDDRLSSTGMTRRVDGYPAEQHRTLAGLRRSVRQWMGLPQLVDHRRLSILLRPFFAPHRVRAWAPRITALADPLLAAFADCGGGDLVAAFARPFTAGVIAHLVGLTAADRNDLLAWATSISEVFHLTDFESLRRAQDTLSEMERHLRCEIARHRQAPADDLIDLFLDGQRRGLVLDEDEIVANLVMFLGGRIRDDRQPDRLRHPPDASAPRPIRTPPA